MFPCFYRISISSKEFISNMIAFLKFIQLFITGKRKQYPKPLNPLSFL